MICQYSGLPWRCINKKTPISGSFHLIHASRPAYGLSCAAMQQREQRPNSDELASNYPSKPAYRPRGERGGRGAYALKQDLADHDPRPPAPDPESGFFVAPKTKLQVSNAPSEE
jgi:hypothetical protein